MNKRLKIAIVLIAIIAIAALAISMAYSRYYTKVTGTGTATVAKWSFKANGETETIAGSIDLGSTTLRDANANVADGKIAPGTSGSISLTLDASGSEVAVDYAVKFTNVKVGGDSVTAFPEYIKFYKDPEHTQAIADITETGLTGTIALANVGTAETASVYWVWEYQRGDTNELKAENDESDTTLGKTPKTITFDITVTGTQKQ